MKRLGLSLAASLLALGSPSLAQAQTGTTAAPGAAARGVIITDHVRTRAQVDAIDYDDRTVLLKREDGNAVTLKVGPQAKNFDRVTVGDQVQVDYYASIAIFVRKSDAPPSVTAVDTVELAAPGETPGGVLTSTREITATVDGVDPDNRVITLTGPRGNTARFKVGDAVEHLDEIHKGDQVVLRYTDAFALSVDKI